MFVLLIRILLFILVLIAIYIGITFFQKRDEQIRLVEEAKKQGLDKTAQDQFVEAKLNTFEDSTRIKRVLFVFVLPIFIAGLLLWLALRT